MPALIHITLCLLLYIIELLIIAHHRASPAAQGYVRELICLYWCLYICDAVHTDNCMCWVVSKLEVVDTFACEHV